MEKALRSAVAVVLFMASFAVPSLAIAAEFYASPSGSASGNGSISSPWNLQTALNHPAAVHPGDTIYLRGGTYNGPFRSWLTGTSGSRITVKSYPGETAIIDNPLNSALSGWAPGASPSLMVSGNYTRYERLEITNSSSKRLWGSSEWLSCYPNCLGSGFEDFGSGNQFIHNVIHDVGIGFGTQGSAGNGSLYYGNLMYYIGWAESGSSAYNGRGHAFYVQNDCSGGRKRLENNIEFWGTSYSQQIYGSSGASVECVDTIGNVIIDNGRLDYSQSGGSLSGAGILIGGTAGASDVKVEDNVVFQTQGCGTMSRYDGFRPAYMVAPNGLTIRNNYFNGCDAIDYSTSLPNLAHSGNVWAGGLGNDPALVQSQFSGDAFLISGDAATRVYERWSEYDDTWGYLAIVNGSNASTVSWTPTGCSSGESVELRDAMNPTGAALHTFSCGGGAKTITMDYSGPVVSPIGNGAAQPVHTGRGFRAFILTKSGDTPAPDTTAPAISSISSGTPGATTATITWTTDEAAASRIEYGLTSSYGSATATTSSATSHSISLSGLSSGTTYHFRAVSADSAGNTRYSTDRTLTTSAAASSGSGSGSSGGSGGGGGGGSSTVTAPSSPAQGAQTSVPAVSQPGTAASSAPVASFLSRDLSVGSRGSDVLSLQVFLISSGHLAQGNDSGYFGPLTKAAVMKFQAANGIEQVGAVGPKTRALINSMRGGSSVAISDREALIESIKQQIAALLAIVQNLMAEIQRRGGN